MNNIFQSRIEATKIISEWLQLKMNTQFNEEINLNDSYLIDIDGTGMVLPTDGESSLNEGQKSYLNTFCNMINRPTITLEEMKLEVKNYSHNNTPHYIRWGVLL